MPQDPLGFEIVGGSTPPAQPSTPAPTTDPMGFPVVGGGASKSPSQDTPAPKTDPLGFQIVSPESGQSEQDTTIGRRFKQAWNAPGQGVMGHIWGVLNTPTVDPLSALGATSTAGGFAKGANDLVGGLTSPLSIALTVGTLGLGGLVEAGGTSVLRAVGLAAPEIEEVTKGAQIISDAAKAGKTAAEGMQAAQDAGINPATLNKGLQALKEASLDKTSLLSKGLARNAGTQVASKLGLSAKAADNVGQGFQFLVAAGFTAQQAQQAAELSPRVLDAMRDGDWSTAERLGIDALGSAALGSLGAHELAKESGGFMSDAAAKVGLKVKPSEENLAIRNNFGTYDKEVATAGRTAELWAADLRHEYPKMTPQQLERIRYYVESGLDADTMSARRDSLAEAAGRDRTNPENGQAVTFGLAPDRLREVIDQKNLAAKYKPAEIDHLLDSYDPSQLTDADKEVAAKIRSQFNDTLEYAQKNDALGEGVSNYVTNIWKKEEGPNPAANMASHAANTGEFSTNTSSARARMFDNSFEGQLFGKKLDETDPITLAAHNASTFARVVEARKAVERLADSGTRASDGRPLVALSGTGKVLDGEDPAVMVNPQGRRSIKIADNVVQGLKDSGDLDRLVKEGKIQNLTRTINVDNLQPQIDRLERSMIGAQPKFDAEGNSVLLKAIDTLKAVRDGKLPKSALDEINAQRPDTFAWSPQDYSHVDHPSLQGWNHVAQSPSGDAVLMKSDMLVHPSIKDYIERRLGVDSQGPADNPVGRALMKVNAESKGLTLSLSPFHILQIGLRGVMSGVSPFKIEKWDLAADPVLAKGVEQGLTLKTNYKNRSAFSGGTMEGHSMILDKIPGLRTIQGSMNSFLFDRYIPAVKSSVYKALVDRYQQAYPEWTPEKAAEVAADDTNARLGGINYKKLGRAVATQNFFKMSTLASDWLESEIRSIARPFGTEGKIARQDMARITGYLWLSARVLNMLTTGTPHMEAPFGVAYRTDSGKEAVISMRSLPSDMLHAVSDPYGFIRGRVSPLVHAGSELYSGTDSFGRKLTKPDLFADILRNTTPIPTQSIGKSITGLGPETGNVGQLINAAGGTDTIYRTEAQKTAAQLASDRSESGPVNQEQLARHQHLQELENQLRVGQITHQQVQDLYIDGHITQAEKGKIDKNFTQTKGLPADQAQLLIRASRLGAPDLLKIWSVATPVEKSVLAKTMTNAKTKYINNAVKNMTPQQRQDDPTIKQLRTMFVTPQAF